MFKLIRYISLKIMKALYQVDDDRPGIAAADYLLEKILPSAFSVFRDSQFRKIIDFDKQSQVEQDRIFNELEGSAIVLGLFCLEQREAFLQYESFHFWENTQKNLPICFVQKLIDLGVEKKNADLFAELITMRRDEYAKFSEASREELEKEVNSDKLRSKAAFDTLVRVQAIAIGTASHIRRGNLKPEDGLIRHLRMWLFALDLEITQFIKKL